MNRRTFVKSTSLFAISLGAFGKIHWTGTGFAGNNPTTTDILGPFYRPGAPFRTNLNPADYNGILFHLSGVIYKDDGITPYKNSMIEIWQVSHEGIYDNVSENFNYRAAAKTGTDGVYHFITTFPTPYATDKAKTTFRPAHIHMRISGEGENEQDLVTQIYFQGTDYVNDDLYSSAPQAVSRILPITTNAKGEQEVVFDIVMQKEFALDDSAFQKITGVYDMGDGDRLEFYKYGNLLFYKNNGQISDALTFKGNNMFVDFDGAKFIFELLPNEGAKLKLIYLDDNKKEVTLEANRILKY